MQQECVGKADVHQTSNIHPSDMDTLRKKLLDTNGCISIEKHWKHEQGFWNVIAHKQLTRETLKNIDDTIHENARG